MSPAAEHSSPLTPHTAVAACHVPLASPAQELASEFAAGQQQLAGSNNQIHALSWVVQLALASCSSDVRLMTLASATWLSSCTCSICDCFACTPNQISIADAV